MALFAEAVAASVRESTSSRICDSPILVTGEAETTLVE
jgi:hypothetical protein